MGATVGKRDSGFAVSRRCAVVCVSLLVVSAVSFLWSAPKADAAVITVWKSVQPSGSVGTGVPIIVRGSCVFDAYPLVPASVKLSIDGTQVPRASYTASVLRSSVYLYYAPQPPLTDGPHTFAVGVSDSLGRISSKQWSVTIVQPPSAAWVAPGSGETLYEGRPTIVMSLSDNTPGHGLSVNGQIRTGSAIGPVAATFAGASLSGGQASFTPSGELLPGTYYVTASVTDAAGNVRALQSTTSALSFTVVAAPAMSVLSDCGDCHAPMKSAHPTPSTTDCGLCHPGNVNDHMESTEYCEDCHWDGWHTGGSGTSVAVASPCTGCHSLKRPEIVRHSAASVGATHAGSCDGCHNESLLARHSYVPAGSMYETQCDLCHASVDVRVTAGITAGDAACSACHTVNHAAMHDVELTPECQDSCHNSETNLTTIHSGSCGSCHESADDLVVAAIAGGDRSCLGCHPERTETHGYDVAKHLSAETCVGGCHPAELKPLHDVLETPVECAGCHPVRVEAISPWDKTCGACHPDAEHATVASSHVGSDALARDYTSNFSVRTAMSWKSYPFGCSPTPANGQTICHDLSSLPQLHSATDGGGCPVCHSQGPAPAGANECLTCHGTGWYAPATSSGTLSRPGVDHSSSGMITRVGGSGADNYSTQLTNDGSSSYLQFASVNAEAMFGRGFWWLNPNTTTITNVQVLFRAMKLGVSTTTSRITVVMNVGGTTYVSTAAATNPSATAYTQYTHTFATNPKTGVAWTVEDLNDPDSPNGLRAFGVRQTVSDTASIGVTEVYLKVNTPATDYSASPTSGGRAHHYGNYLRSPQTPDGEWSSAVYTQYCYDRCHVYPNTYAYYGQVLGNPAYNPFNAYQGTQMWSSLMGDSSGYSPVERTLTLDAIQLPAGLPVLEFMTNYSLGTGDFGYVEASTDGGSTWTTLSGDVGGSQLSTLSGIAGAWLPSRYDLSAYAGQSVKLRFRYMNTAFAGNAGWCIDSVSVSEGGTILFSDDAETLKPEWDPASDWRRIQYALRWLG